MAIATIKPEANFEPKQKLPEAQPENYKGLTYDNNQVPVTSLLAYIEGAPWTVTYYTQILGAHNDIKPLDTGLSAQYQSYQRIRQMELRVQDDLNGSTDGLAQVTATKGTAFVYAFLEPNVNDYFIAQTSYKQWGLFRVTEVDRHTWRRESVHTIQYHLVDFIDRLQEEMKSLELKTTTDFYFSKERLLEGLTPYLKTEQYEMLSNLRDARQRIGNYYLDTFVSNSCKTLVIPGQKMNRIYDPFLADYVLKIMGYLEFPQCLNIKQLPKTGDVYIEQPQFWEALFNRDKVLLDYGNQQMTVATTTVFPRTSYIKTVYSARIDMLVYPWKADTSAITGDESAPLATFRGCISPTTGAHGVNPDIKDITFFIQGRPIRAYPSAGVNGYYVLSENFYKGVDEELTLIELLTRDYFESRSLDMKQLSFLIGLYPKMPRLEQFYFGPLLLTLMNYADQRMY